jgi:hypothetical protein
LPDDISKITTQAPTHAIFQAAGVLFIEKIFLPATEYDSKYIRDVPRKVYSSLTYVRV